MRFFLAAALLAAVCVVPTNAQKANPVRAFEIRPNESEPTKRLADRRVNTRTGAATALYDLAVPTPAGSPESRARHFLSARAKDLGLRFADGRDLQLSEVAQTNVGHVVRLRQVYNKIPVLSGRIAVTLDQAGRVVYVSSDYKPDVQLASTTPALTAQAARQSALSLLNVQGPLAFEDTKLAVYVNGGQSRLVHQTSVVPSVSPVGDWEVLTDALTGQIVVLRDKAVYHSRKGKRFKRKMAGERADSLRSHTRQTHPLRTTATGTGLVFDPDPLSSAGASYTDTGYGDNSDNDSAQLNAERMSVTLEDITFDGTNYTLIGPYAEIIDTEAPTNGLFAQPSSTFNFTRSQSGFEAVNVYYHVDQTMRYLNETLNLNIMPSLYPGGVRFDPHALNGSDNSNYVGSLQRIAFGEGGVDDAEDADVIIHELGHGLHDWAAGTISQSNGLSEGIGDFVAHSYSRSLNQWSPGDAAYDWMFNWDGHNQFWNGRVTNWNDSNTWPAGTGGGCLHTCGQYWASSMMDIWDVLGRDLTETAHWEGIKMTGGSTTHEDAAQAVIQAAISLSYTPAQVQAICDAFTDTGYTVTCPALGLSLAKTASVSTAPAGSNVTFTLTASAATGVTISGATVTDDLTTGTYVSDTCGAGAPTSGTVWSWSPGTIAGGTSIACDLVVQMPLASSSVVLQDDHEAPTSGWTATAGSGSFNWARNGTNPYSGSNSWFAQNVGSVADQYLAYGSDLVVGAGMQLSVWHNYDTEATYDGGVIEISTDGGTTWVDLIAAGAAVVEGGYNGTISTQYGNPLAGRSAFTGSSSGYAESIFDLSALSGQTIRLRFRMGTDSSVTANGWRVDDVTVGSIAAYANSANATEGSGQFNPTSSVRITLTPPNSFSFGDCDLDNDIDALDILTWNAGSCDINNDGNTDHADFWIIVLNNGRVF